MLSKLEAASSLLLGLALVPRAAAHGHVSEITIDGTSYVIPPPENQQAPSIMLLTKSKNIATPDGSTAFPIWKIPQKSSPGPPL